jgi:hypothetical protein
MYRIFVRGMPPMATIAMLLFVFEFKKARPPLPIGTGVAPAPGKDWCDEIDY